MATVNGQNLPPIFSPDSLWVGATVYFWDIPLQVTHIGRTGFNVNTEPLNGAVGANKKTGTNDRRTVTYEGLLQTEKWLGQQFFPRPTMKPGTVVRPVVQYKQQANTLRYFGASEKQKLADLAGKMLSGDVKDIEVVALEVRYKVKA